MMWKRICLMVLSLLLALSVQIKAENKETVTLSGEPLGYTYYVEDEEYGDNSDYYHCIILTSRRIIYEGTSKEGDLSYCLEPYMGLSRDKKIQADVLNFETYNGLSQKQKEELNYVAYFGYGYDNHLSNEWFAYTQYRIWQIVRPQSDVDFRIGEDLYNFYDLPKADFAKLEKELNTLIDSYKRGSKLVIDSENKDLYEVNVGDIIEVKDLNNNLNNLRIDYLGEGLKLVAKDGKDISWNELRGDSFYLQIIKEGEFEIKLKDIRGEKRKLPKAQFIIKEKKLLDSGKWGEQNEYRVGYLENKAPDYKLKFNSLTYELEIQKRDLANNELITYSGASFKIFDLKNNNYVIQEIDGIAYDTYATDISGKLGVYEGKEGSVILPLKLKSGSYRLEEVEAPYGYHLKEDLIFEISAAKARDGRVIISAYDESIKGKINIKKIIKEVACEYCYQKDINLNEIGFSLYAAADIIDPRDGSIIYQENELVSSMNADDEGKLSFEDLYLGTYRLVEDCYPTGIVPLEDIIVNLNEEVAEVNYELDNYLTLLRIHKIDAKGNFLKGVKFSLYDEENKLIHQFFSAECAYTIGGLELNKKYYLYEDEALVGYARSGVMEFSIAGKEKDITIINKQVKIKKMAVDTGEFLEGALLAIYDTDGNEIEQWHSTKQYYSLSNLEVGKTYILRELEAPEGYLIAPELSFIVTEGEDQYITLADRPDVPNTGSGIA